LTSVDRSADAKELYGEPAIKKIVEPGGFRNYFEDRLVGITWWVKPDDISCIIYSKINIPIEIAWNEAKFIDVNGSAHNLVHTAFSEADRDEKSDSPLTTVIPGKDILVCSLYPADHVHRWQKDMILPDKTGGAVEELRSKAEPLIGKNLQVILSFRVAGKRHVYSFIFRVNGVDVSEMTYRSENTSNDRAKSRKGGRKNFEAD
jgi:hypothetical protein